MPRWLFFFQAEDGIRGWSVTGVQTCALPIFGLEARLCPTKGNPVIVAKTPKTGGAVLGAPRSNRRPHFVIYGHYDVQPPEPFELWKSPPFEPRIEGRSLFVRGASDNNGQNLA